MTLMIRGRRALCGFPARGLILTFILVIILLSAGCLEPYPGGEGQEVPSGPGETPAATGTMTPVPTTVPGARGIPADVPASGYIERSYGYVAITGQPENSLSYIEATGTKDASGKVTITGRIRNDGPGPLNFLHVTYNLFDANGNILGNAHASVEYVGSGKTWKFTTEPVSVPGYQYFELAGIVMQ
ncbi:MAG: hypothetical protein GKC05_02780 [Methanomicrobiales archaeon]|nr:hypothetical protein [Methanomicrobiales archaeon]NYT21648.1 hypothetical protein [Methanomicrobiales archaeon]